MIGSQDPRALGLFYGYDEPTPEVVWDFYQNGVSYNENIDLYDCVKVNRNFYIGKQWEGVQSNGLPTPVYNFLKRTVGFVTATITSDSIKINISEMGQAKNNKKKPPVEPADILNAEFDAIQERIRFVSLVRKFVLDAAVDGNGCMHFYWDTSRKTSKDIKGAINAEVLDSTKVLFGDTAENDPQKQPFIIIVNHELLRNVKKRARDNGVDKWWEITADGCPDERAEDDAKKDYSYERCTTLLIYYRDEDTDDIWAYECTPDHVIREPWKIGIKRYPLVWLSWDDVHDSYRGQAMITGLIQNQLFVNRLWAMQSVNLTHNAFPRIVYDKSRVQKWDNRVGSAIPVIGGDVNTVARVLEAPSASPQVQQFIQLAVEMTQSNMGATSVALGDTRPDNSSAIIALQRSSQTPHEVTKQRVFACLEEAGRIELEFIANFYGEAETDLPPTAQITEMMEFADMEIPHDITVKFNFDECRTHDFDLKIDVGACSYYSEMAQLQTLDNLLMNGHIDIIDYLERVPSTNMLKREELLAKKKAEQEKQKQQQQMMEQMMMMQQQGGPVSPPSREQEQYVDTNNSKNGKKYKASVDNNLNATADKAPEVQGGKGYSHLQRQINKGEDVNKSHGR